MDRKHWQAAGISVAAAIAVILAGNWFAHKLIAVSYPGTLAARPADDLPPPIDLASLQRGWPNGLDNPGEDGRLIAYRQERERRTPLPVGSPTTAPAAPIDLGALLANANVNAGKGKAAACATCHDFTAAGPDRIGPSLWNVIGRKVASHGGFAYSQAMAKQQGAWTYDRLFTFLASPSRAVPGTKMSFAGLARPEDRAAVIKYLSTLGDHIQPLPRPLPPGKTEVVTR